MKILNFSSSGGECYNPTLKECEDDIHTPEMWTWKSSETPEYSELDCRGKNTHLELFFIPLERPQSSDVENGLT
jgi:hypothetical protein